MLLSGSTSGLLAGFNRLIGSELLQNRPYLYLYDLGRLTSLTLS